ncbi:MAG: NMD3-related protein [Methanomassiliicoccaceae archaeon]|nr:NMD3-related protein [Methanomassiliicoccaceae archaeon]
MFCVKCGKEEETFRGLCIDCFLDGKQLITLPVHIDLERCANCEEFRINGRWVKETAAAAAEDAAISQMSAIDGMRIITVGAEAEELDERNFHVMADVSGELSDRAVTAAAETIVRIKNNVCRKCSRQLGNYYEATLQIRSGSKELSAELRDETVRYVRERIENISSINRQIFLTKVEEVQGGVDMLLSSISLARSLAKELSDTYGAETKESSKLVGKTAGGSDMYRMTYLVRMPEYHLNDVVIFEDKVHKLSGITKGGGKLTRLGDFNASTVRRSRMTEMKVHTSYDSLMEATVVSRSAGEIQILHPLNYTTVDVRIPDGAEIGDTVNVADIDGTLFFVP